MKKLLLFLLLAGSVLAFGQEQKLVTVEARGMGTSPDAATKDALSQAIQQAAGAIVDSQTLMKNDEIMQEKILTASNAIVKKYDVVVPVKKNRNGLFEIRIKAQVEQNLLRQKLVEHKIIAGEVEGTQNIWAEVVTGEKNKVDMQAMIENIFSKIDFKRYLRFTLIGVNGTQGNQTKLYMKPDPRDKTKIIIACGLVCIFDAARFQKECMPHIKKILDSLPFDQKEVFTHQIEPEIRNYMLPPTGYAPQRGRMPDAQRRSLAQNGIEVIASLKHTPVYGWGGGFALYKSSGISGNGRRIYLNISRKYRPGSQQYVCYVTGKCGLYELVQKKMADFDKSSVSVCLLDGDGNEVRRMTMNFGGRYVADRIFEGIGCFEYGGSHVVISPEFFKGFGMSSDTVSSPVLILPMHTTVDLEDFKEIKSFKLEVKMNK